LQEASARITVVSGLNLGEAMRREYGSTRLGRFTITLALIAVITGCAAYEAGNILGAVAGIQLITATIPLPVIVTGIGLIAAVLLWKGSIRQIAAFLGIIVAFMGLCFLITVVMMPHDFSDILAGGLRPSIEPGSELLVLGLIGTTVVPYSIFLGSGLKHDQSPSEMRVSMMIAIGLGGLISISILLTGTAVIGEFSFESLAETLNNELGSGANLLLAVGLFGAGLSSALTAALAASITAKSLLSEDQNDPDWAETGKWFRGVWIGVLATGLLFGLIQLQPVPIIILAQALNGVILPIIAVILFLLMNSENVLPVGYRNGKLTNGTMSVVVYLTILIGLTNLFRAGSRMLGLETINESVLILISLGIFLIVIIPTVKRLYKRDPIGSSDDH
tara:strand:- start:76 stop:1248 length:1173 start_codon:yes stop_codon:yes gene_type:complete